MRFVAAFVPYRCVGNETLFFLQKRTEDAPTSPGYFALFGGGIEGSESPEEAVYREVWEELVYRPSILRTFGKFELTDFWGWVYGEEVAEDFSSHIKVLEGDYGIWMSMEQVAREEKMTLDIKTVLRDVERQVRNHASRTD